MYKNKKLAYIFISLIVIVLLFTGCNTKSPTVPPLPSPTPQIEGTPISGTYQDPVSGIVVTYKDVVISPDVVVLDPENTRGASMSGDSIILSPSKDVSSKVNSIKEGTILVFKKDTSWILLRVTGIETGERGSKTLETENAYLENVFLSGTIEIDKDVSLSEYQGLFQNEDPSRFTVSTEKTFEKDFNYKGFKFHGETTMGLKIHVKIKLKFSWGVPKYMSLKITGNPYIDVKLSSALLSMNKDTKNKSKYDDKSELNITLIDTTVANPRYVVFVGAVPLEVSFPLYVHAGIDLSVADEFAVGVRTSMTIGGKVTWEKGEGTSKSNWSKVKFKPYYEFPEAKGKADMYLYLKLSGKVYEVMGPFISIRSGGLLKAELKSYGLLWKLYGYAKSYMGFNVHVLSYDFTTKKKLFKLIDLLAKDKIHL